MWNTTMPKLSPEAAHIFRITHVRNVPWIFRHGVHCKNSELTDPNFVPIGMPELIQKRAIHPVPITPGGPLAWVYKLWSTKCRKHP